MGTDVSILKKRAALHAVDWVASGMVLGLGHGTTTFFAIREIAARVRSGLLSNIRAVPCSREVRRVAQTLGIPLTNLNRNPVIDLTIDGADEVDGTLNLIKGGGGALLREKMVAQATRREVIVMDESKISPILGTQRPVPLEVIPFGWRSHVRFPERLGARVTVRRDERGHLFRTDQNNLLLDGYFGPITDPQRLASELNRRAGIVEHGLFLQIAGEVVVAGESGLRHLKRR